MNSNDHILGAGRRKRCQGSCPWKKDKRGRKAAGEPEAKDGETGEDDEMPDCPAFNPFVARAMAFGQGFYPRRWMRHFHEAGAPQGKYYEPGCEENAEQVILNSSDTENEEQAPHKKCHEAPSGVGPQRRHNRTGRHGYGFPPHWGRWWRHHMNQFWQPGWEEYREDDSEEAGVEGTAAVADAQSGSRNGHCPRKGSRHMWNKPVHGENIQLIKHS